MVSDQSKSEKPQLVQIEEPKQNWITFVLTVVFFLVTAAAYLAIRQMDLSGATAYVVQGIMLVSVVFLIGKGADWLVESASHLAETLGMSHLVIGLTVVAFGTSAPEMVVSVGEGLKGNGDITIANVIGSNVFNICIILGSVAVIARQGLPIERELMFRDGPLLVGSSILLFLFVGGMPSSGVSSDLGFGPQWLRMMNFSLERAEGLILALGLALYLLWLYHLARSAKKVLEFEHENVGGLGWEQKKPPHVLLPSILKDLVVLTASLTLVLSACHLLVGEVEVLNDSIKGYGALWFAKMLGVPSYVVGLTIVAAGTSAPELVVSLYAAIKGHYGLCVGNLIGSSLFNVLGVVGISGAFLQKPLSDPVTVTPAASVNLMVLIGLSAVVAFFMWSKQRISRLEGVILVLLGLGCWIRDFA